MTGKIALSRLSSPSTGTPGEGREGVQSNNAIANNLYNISL